jgi:sulfatase modifying factor 1
MKQIPRIVLWAILLSLRIPGAPEATAAPTPPPGMIYLPGGSYKPLYAKEAKPRATPGCFLCEVPVTNAQFLAFVREHPSWQRSRVTREMADANYLRDWAGDLDPGSPAGKRANAPVTNVSWFAARAYAEAHGQRLPTQDEWELAARADATRIDASTDQKFLQKLLEWYALPVVGGLPEVSSCEANVYGLRGLHGLVWEWVNDFNSTMLVGDSRGDDSLERKLFCGASSLFASDVSNYAAFMRYAFRSSLKGNYCIASLGFRTAKSLHDNLPVPPTAVAAAPYELTSKWNSLNKNGIVLSSLKGKVRVVTMGFTSCRYACPRIVGDLQRIETALGPDAAKIGFVFISIDPTRDTSEKLKTFATGRKVDLANWEFLNGSAEGIRDLAVALAFQYQQVEENFAHSNLIAVIDAEGKVVHREEEVGADIQPSVESIKKLLATP